MLQSLTRQYWDDVWKNQSENLISQFGYNLIDNPIGKTLEVGCGVLSYSSLPWKSDYFVGIDLSLVALNYCKRFINSSKKGKKFFSVASVLALPFKDNHFDESFAFEVLHLLGYNYFKALEEMKRVTKSRLTFNLRHKDFAGLVYSLHKKEEDCTIFSHQDCNIVAFEEKNIESILKRLNLEPEQIKLFTDEEAVETTISKFDQYQFIEYPKTKAQFLIKAKK